MANKPIGFGSQPEKKNPLAPFSEVGKPGNTGLYGAAETGEYIQNLTGVEGAKTFNKMRRSDPQCQMMLRLITNPITSTQYRVDPASSSQRDIEIAKIVEKAILTDLPWQRIIRHVCLMFPFGFSPMEKTWHYKNGLAVPKSIEPRLPWTVNRWITDQSGELTHLEQANIDGQLFEIPVTKLMLFATDREGDNWEGVSVLRAAYKPWFIKSNLEKIDAIKHDRYGVGIPYFKAGEGASPEDATWKNSEKILKNIRANETSGIIVPEGWDFGIASPQGGASGTDAIASIRYHDEQIAKCILAMFASLGTTSGGNRALGEVMLSQFLDSEQSYADYIAGEFQRLVDEMVAYNWKDTPSPRFMAGKVSKVDQDAIRAMASAGIITPDIELENYVRRVSNLPEKKELAAPVAPVAPADEPMLSDKCGCGKDHRPIQAADTVRAQKEAAYMAAICDPASYALQLNSAESTLAAKLNTIRKAQAESVKSQYLAGKRPQQIVVPLKKEMFEAASAEFERMAQVGADQVKKEIEKQARGKSLAAVKSLPWGEVEKYEQDYLSLLVDGASNKLSNMVGTIYIRKKREGKTGTDLDKEIGREINKISDATWDQVAKAVVNRGWGLGREQQATEYKDKVRVAHYSTVMEDGTGIPCPVCLDTYNNQRVDPYSGELVHDYGDPNFQAPNPECLGTADRCRCINVYVIGDSL